MPGAGTTDMTSNMILLQQLQQDLLQVIGDPSRVANFFHDHPFGHIDDILCHFGTQVKKDLLYKACTKGHINLLRYLIGERRVNQDKYKYFASIKADNVDLHPNSEKVFFKSSTRSETTQLHVNNMTDAVYYLADDRACDPLVKDNRQNTPLHVACIYGHLSIVDYLISELLCNLEVIGQYQLTPLHCACHQGHIDIVRYLVRQGCNINAVSEAQNTPLHMACSNNHFDIVCYLVNEGGNLNMKNHFQATPLHSACDAGHVRIVRYLVEQGCESESRPTLMHTACKKGHIDIIRFFLEQECHSSIEVQTLLHTACSCGHIEIVQYLISELGCDPNVRDNNGKTLLHLACTEGHTDIARFLASEQGCDPNIKDAEQETPLYYACIEGYTDLVRYLVSELGCDPSIPSGDGITPVHAACMFGHTDIAQYLIGERGYDRNIRDAHQTTPLHYASISGNINLVRYLVNDQGCDPNVRDMLLATPLHAATMMGHIEIVRYFIDECGCDPSIKNYFEVTLLQFACNGGHINVIKYFIDTLGYDINLEYQHQFTLLHMACRKGDMALVRYLAEQGANLSARTDEQATPLDIACTHGHIDIARYLIHERGLNPSLEDMEITPLFYACWYGHIDIVRYLVHELGCDPRVKCKRISDSTPMHIICEVGHIDIVYYLFGECNYDPNFKNTLGATPLHTACCHGQAKIVHYLTSQQQCDLEVRDQYGYTPLHYACLESRNELKFSHNFVTSIQGDMNALLNVSLNAQSKGTSDLVQYVIEQAHDSKAKGDNTEIVRYLSEQGCNPNAKNNSGETPLHVACSSGYLGIVHYLVEQAKCNVNTKNNTKATPLHKACVNGHTAIVHYLVKQGCCLDAQDSNHSTPLYIACEKGHIEIVQYLSEEGCDPFMKNENYTSPFQCAIAKGHIEVIKYFVRIHGKGIVNGSICCLKFASTACPTLLQKSTMIYRPTDITPLHVACINGQLGLVRYLVEEVGVNQNKKCPFGTESSITPLSCACNHGHLDIVQYLLANTHSYGKMLESEIRRVCFDGHAPIVNYFISDRNVDPNTEDKYENNLLQYAVSGSNINSNLEGALEVLRILTSNKRLNNLNKKNYFGDTALHTACILKQLLLVRCLLEGNCDPNVKNIAGCTPLWTTQEFDVIKEFMPYTPTSVCERILSDDIDDSRSFELLLLLIKQYSWDPSEIINGGNTALHLACETNKLKVVEYLLSINCDPILRNRKGDTPLEMTSSLDIIRVFISHSAVCSIDFLNNPIITEAEILQLINELPVYSEDGRDLIAVNQNGDTALHLACKTNRPIVAKFLLQECEIDWDVNAKNCLGVSPIQLSTNSDVIRELIRHGARPVELYSYCRRVLRTSKLLETSVKVFVIGDEDVGKSTLISSLQREEWFLIRIINYIKSLIVKDQIHINTQIHHNVVTGSGVLIDDFNSRSYGRVQLYDFVGDRLFHDSQSDLLKETEFSPRIFLIVIDLSQELEKIKLSIRSWLSFLESTQSKPKSHTVFIGNKFDPSRNDIQAKVEVFLEKVTPKFLNVNYYDFIIVDCRDSFSSDMFQLRHCLDISCSIMRNPNTLAFNTHCFQVYLLDKFRDSVAITVHDIQNRIEKDKQNVTANEPLFFLPYNSLRNLLKLCSELHQKSRFLFLKDSVNIEDSWVVINKTALMAHTLDVFQSEPEYFTTNTGVLALSTIAGVEEFKAYNLQMFMNFLTHLEYCREIADEEIYYQLITETRCLTSASERWFFFPGLVKRGFPEGIWKQDSSFTYYFGWILQCTNGEQFFTSQFSHVVILRVMFTYSDSTSISTELPLVEQKCSVWKSGIFWANQFGAESMVDMLPDNQSIVFMMRCRNANIVQCIEHRSRVISKLRKCAKEFCPEIKMSESFINPAKVMEYPSDISTSNLFDIKSVAEGTVNLKLLEKSFVRSKTNSISLDDLLKFEPFAKLPASILSELYNQHNPQYISIVPNHFLARVAEQIGKIPLFLKVISCILCEYNILQLRHPAVSKDNLFIKLVKWRDAYKITYGCLQKSLDQFSIFIGLNILDMIPGLVHENEDFTTPSSSPATSRRNSIQSEDNIESEGEDADSEGEAESSPDYQQHDPQLGEQPKLHLLYMLDNHRDQTVIRVTETVAADWELLARTLGFDESRIRIINRECWRQLEEACFAMFSRWLDGEHDLKPPTWHSLIQCLERTDKFEGLAYELKKVIMLQRDNKPTIYQLHTLKAEDGTEVNVIEIVADNDWGRMANALGFDGLTRIHIFEQANYKPEVACKCMFEQWLKGGEGLKPTTWRDLIKCLEDSGYNDLANKVNKFMLR